MKAWKQVVLGDLAEITSSKRIYLSDYVSFGIPFYRSKEVIQLHNKKMITSELFIHRDKFDAIKSKFGVPQKNDILLTSVGTLGVPYLVKEGNSFYFKDGNLTWLRKFNSSVNSKFLYIWMDSEFGKNNILSHSIGVAQPALTIVNLKKVKILLPPLDVQNAIASFIDCYDDLIETNNQRIDTLEQIAQQVYKEWFVRMRFPDWENTQFNHGVPEGWEVKKIGGLCSKITDGSHLSPAFVEGGKPMASVKDMNAFGFSLENIKTIAERDFEKLKNSDCLPLKNDVLIAKDGSYLKHVFVWDEELEIVILSSIAILRPKINISPYYLSLTLKQDSTKSMMSCYVSGAALPRIILDDFKKMKILMPEASVLLKFDEHVKPIFQQIRIHIKQNEVLVKTRDRLLPRLISGKLSIKQAESLTP